MCQEGLQPSADMQNAQQQPAAAAAAQAVHSDSVTAGSLEGLDEILRMDPDSQFGAMPAATTVATSQGTAKDTPHAALFGHSALTGGLIGGVPQQQNDLVGAANWQPDTGVAHGRERSISAPPAQHQGAVGYQFQQPQHYQPPPQQPLQQAGGVAGVPMRLMQPALTPLEATLFGRSASTNAMRQKFQQGAISSFTPQQCVTVPLWSLVDHTTAAPTIHPDFLHFSVLVPTGSGAHEHSRRQQASPEASLRILGPTSTVVGTVAPVAPARPAPAAASQKAESHTAAGAGAAAGAGPKKRRARQFEDDATRCQPPNKVQPGKKAPRLDLAWDGAGVAKPSVLQCRGINRKRKTRCGNPALMEYVGPRPLYCAEHIESDPAAEYHKCGHVLSTMAHGREKRCKEIVYKEFKHCYKHLDGWLKQDQAGDGSAPKVTSALATARRLATQLQNEAAEAKSDDLELYQRKLKILRKYQSMISTLEQHLEQHNASAVAQPSPTVKSESAGVDRHNT